jgi:hypothetical protein
MRVNLYPNDILVLGGGCLAENFANKTMRMDVYGAAGVGPIAAGRDETARSIAAPTLSRLIFAQCDTGMIGAEL